MLSLLWCLFYERERRERDESKRKSRRGRKEGTRKEIEKLERKSPSPPDRSIPESSSAVVLVELSMLIVDGRDGRGRRRFQDRVGSGVGDDARRFVAVDGGKWRRTERLASRPERE